MPTHRPERCDSRFATPSGSQRSASPGRRGSTTLRRSWELYAINLLPRAQGTGLADELLDRSLGDRAAYLWVIEGNERAQAFYRKHGFADDGGRTVDEPSGAPEIRMVRPTVGQRPRQ